MNINVKIDLPPLPEGMVLEGIWACPEDELISYRDACIQAAIKADRKQRHLKEKAQLEQEWSLLKSMQSQYEADRKCRGSIVSNASASSEPAGEAGTMPGTSGFTMACFPADKVPVGTSLYLAPQPLSEGETPAGTGKADVKASVPSENDLWPNGSVRYFCDRCSMTLGAEVVLEIVKDFNPAQPAEGSRHV